MDVHRRLLRFALLISSLAIATSDCAKLNAQVPQWIWAPAGRTPDAGGQACFFRKSIEIGPPESARIEITCDEQYELFVNGQKAAEGKDWRILDSHDLTRNLRPGANLIAVRARKDAAGPTGLVAKLVVKGRDGQQTVVISDSSWRVSRIGFAGWEIPKFDDRRWEPAQELGPLGEAKPWGNAVKTSAGVAPGRFSVLRGFRVESVLDPEETGSLIAMTFNEFGDILTSREDGPLLMVRDTNNDGVPDRLMTYCEEVRKCQGILALNGQVFVVGDGPQGAGLYRLTDPDRDGQVDEVVALIEFAGPMGEHGPHGVILGPDGLLYVVVGNHSAPKMAYDPFSPHRYFYEGDLPIPRYEDPSGHAAGKKSPGGVVIRTDTEGSFMELVAGGLRNPYDIAFGTDGELFTFDSDMEWDMGLPWYRPTRLNHLLPGGEYGWRSGWAKWPEYYFDSLPATLNVGPGSPTGMVNYEHFMFPASFHDTIFACDWSQGRILNIRPTRSGASYKAASHVFLTGRPLNVTDIDVGPDGWLYFCTGGRDTEGGIFRVVWDGRIPESVKSLGFGITKALRQPQPNSPWGQQEIAAVKAALGDDWGSELTAAASFKDNPAEVRVHALHLMELFGPFPSAPLLIELSLDRNEEIRAKVAFLMGIHPDPDTSIRLIELMHDSSAFVRRRACEAIIRSGLDVPVEHVLPMLADSDRHVSWTAMRVLQQIPRERWTKTVLETKEQRRFLMGTLALLRAEPNREECLAVLHQIGAFLRQPVRDPEFIDLLRLAEIALLQSGIQRADVPELSAQFAQEFPAQHHLMNRELMRLLAYLGETAANARIISHLESDIPPVEKLHVALMARFLSGWTSDQKLVLIRFYEQTRNQEGGHSLGGYVEGAARDFAALLNGDELMLVLNRASEWPTTALGVLARLPQPLDSETITQLITLDRELVGARQEAAKRLAVGVIAVLGGSGDAGAMAYLRDVFESEPERRAVVAMGLAQQPIGENWPLLVRSLSVVEGAAANEVISALLQSDQQPDAPEPIRQVILLGLSLQENGAQNAVRLLEKWTAQTNSKQGDSWQTALSAWQGWFREVFPEEPEPELPVADGNSWSLDELLTYLDGDAGSQGDAAHGARVFEKAECSKCHRFQGRGEGIGPDLTTVGQRFQKKEILESVLFPSHVISDQYASRTVVTDDGRRITGIVVPRGDAAIVMQSNGELVTVTKDEIDEIVPSKTSAMPEGLFNNLTLAEIGDLVTFLTEAPTETASGASTNHIR